METGYTTVLTEMSKRCCPRRWPRLAPNFRSMWPANHLLRTWFMCSNIQIADWGTKLPGRTGIDLVHQKTLYSCYLFSI